MSLDVTLTRLAPRAVYSRNITHNLGLMAKEAGIYLHLWHPEKVGASKAWHLIDSLRAGLKLLQSNPTRFRKFDSPNGWGRYEDLVSFVHDYLSACESNPDADVKVSR